MNYLSYVNQYMVRLGLVNCVCAVAQRELDTVEAVHRRFDELVFRRVYDDDPEFDHLLGKADTDSLASLQKLPSRRKETQSPFPDAVPDRPGRRWYYVGEMWVAMRGLPSHAGYPSKPQSHHYIRLARSLGLILSNYSLSETGNLINWRMTGGESNPGWIKPGLNPLDIWSDEITKLCLLYSILSRDILAPYILLRMGSDPKPAVTDALPLAADDLLEAIRDRAQIQDILVAKDVYKFRERLSSQPVRRNQLRPRLEHYVDLGLLRKKGGTSGDADIGYAEAVDQDTLARAFGVLVKDPLNQDRWMDTEFFQAAAALYSRNLRDPSDDEVLRYFVGAFPDVRRVIGFTPGRTVALLAGINAWLDGVRLEITKTFDSVYAAARGPHSKLFQFSGGSRLDREFLISVRPEAEKEIGALGHR